jgi:hypothetical protein
MTNGGRSDACKTRNESIEGTWQLGAKSERRDATHVPNEGIAPKLLADPIAGTGRTITLITPRRKSVTHRTHADAERHPPRSRYSQEVSGSSDRSVQHSAHKAVGVFRSVKLSPVGPVKLSPIKGTGEASPVRGRDWAGFKFAAK